MLRLAFKAVKHNPKRLILTTVAVVLGVAFVSSVHTFTSSIDRQFIEMMEESYSGADITVADEDALGIMALNASTFPDTVLDDALAIDGVAYGSGALWDLAVILTPEGEVPVQTGAPNFLFTWDDNTDLRLTTIVQGRAPKYPGEAVVDYYGLERFGYEIGGTLLVATDDGIARYTIVGASQFGASNDLSSATMVHLTLEDMQELMDAEGQFNDIALVVDEGADVDEVVEAIRDVLPEGIVAMSNQVLLEQFKEEFHDLLRWVDIFTLVFALIAVFVGSFIIANTFRIIVTQRTREIGLVRALGARGSQVRGQILIEALIVAVGASIIGIGVGYLLALLLIAGSSAADPGLNFPTPGLPLDAIVWGVAVGLLVTLVSAFLPAVHASQISPMEALREAGTHSRKPLRTRNVIAVSLIGASIAVISTSLYTSISQPGIWVGAASAALVIGVSLLSAQVLVTMARASRSLLGRLFSVNGRLAAGNIEREPRRAGVTASALMIGVLLLSLVATFTETIKAVARSQIEGEYSAELYVSGGMTSTSFVNVSPTAQTIIENTPGVEQITSIGITFAELDGDDVFVGIVDPDVIGDLWNSPTDPPPSEIGFLETVITPTLEDEGYSVGDTITVVGNDATLDLDVVGRYTREGDISLGVTWETAELLDSQAINYMVLIGVEPGADVDEVQAAIAERLEDFPLLLVQQESEIIQELNTFIDSLLLMITLLLSAALVIAILGVANTMSLSVTERTREIGLLRAVGLRRGSVWRMITLESVIIAVFGAVVGSILGVGLGAAIIDSLESFGFGTPVVPYKWLGIYILMAIIAGIIAAIAPAARASKVDILQAVTTE
jgi:putative ABC transport system permease protein